MLIDVGDRHEGVSNIAKTALKVFGGFVASHQCYRLTLGRSLSYKLLMGTAPLQKMLRISHLKHDSKTLMRVRATGCKRCIGVGFKRSIMRGGMLVVKTHVGVRAKILE